MQMLDSTILNTSLPSIAKDLNESPLNMIRDEKSFCFFFGLVQFRISVLCNFSESDAFGDFKGYSGSWRKLDDTRWKISFN